jgi:hypothetical protein
LLATQVERWASPNIPSSSPLGEHTVRPNLAFGPIDSVTQYLLYLSVVVFGILLPLAIQKWLKTRHDKQLLVTTRTALAEEVSANLKKVLKSRDSFVTLAALLEDEIAQYKGIWEKQANAATRSSEPTTPANTDSPVTYAAPIQTAWDIANIRQALPLMPATELAAYARAYQLQLALEQNRSTFLAVAMRANSLDAPTDLTCLQNIERRIEILLELQAMSRHHAGLTQALADAYEEALRSDA